MKRKIIQKKEIIVLFGFFIFLVAIFFPVMTIFAEYSGSGSFTSTNLLSGVGDVNSITQFFSSSTIPAGTSLWAQFSQDSANWYDENGTLNATTSIMAGASFIDISSLMWEGANFYYKIGFISNGSDTPVLYEAGVYYTVFAEMMSTSYKIQESSINTGGLDVATSGSYKIMDTIGEVGTGNASSTLYRVKAGYRQMEVDYSISISGGGATVLAPNIGGVTGGTATATTSFTVITSNPGGYVLSVKADTNPALKSGSYSFTDYTSASTSTPDYEWLISSSDSEFGFSPEGTDIVQKFKDDGGSCNTGESDNPDKCWYGLNTSNESISNSGSANNPSGTQTTIKLKAESGSSHIQEVGVYTATITATAITN
jgi:hypothetical protein